jgi:oxalate decarboxylase/phosphoglucose isomerase-like protein (cupin superfamily)
VNRSEEIRDFLGKDAYPAPFTNPDARRDRCKNPGPSSSRVPSDLARDIVARRSDIMSDRTLPSFRYRLEQQPSRTGSGGLVRAASVRQFPVSKGIAGASMRLQPGSLRELHRHTTAAEFGYVVSGSCRTTVLGPEGAATDTFGPGDVWYFPRGWGHSIHGIGSSECHFILIFDNGDFSEDHTLSVRPDSS